MKGGKLINKGAKGVVYDSKDLINELKNINEVLIIYINKNGRIINKKVKVIDIIDKINDKLLVKKFIEYNIIIGETKDNFNNELNGYKKMIKIFGNKVEKFTTIKEAFIYEGNKIYGIVFENSYYIFLEKCENTIDKVKFTQKKFNKFSKTIFKILKLLEKHKFLHNDIKPSNIIECNGNFKLIDWELSYSLPKQVKGFYLNKNGNFIYNHPIKFYYTGIPFLINKLVYLFKFLSNKDLVKLKSPLIIRNLIEESFSYLEKNKYHYYKYSDYFAFALVHIYIAEKNNLKISLKLINPILNMFNIKMI